MRPFLSLVLIAKVEPGRLGRPGMMPSRRFVHTGNPWSRLAGWTLIGLVLGSPGSVEGQAFQVDGGGASAASFHSAATTGGEFLAGEVLRAEVNHGSESNSVAVVGISKPQAGRGTGGYFIGGLHGVSGEAKLPGDGTRVGVVGISGNSTVENYGVWAQAVAPSLRTSAAYGVLGDGTCSGGTDCSAYGVYANGDLVYTGSTYQVSDLRFKESLAPLEQALDSLLALEVVSYEHVRTPEAARLNLPEGRRVGFIAQQVAEVLPELVGEVLHPATVDPRHAGPEAVPIPYQALKPIDLIPYLVRALQEQQSQIEALRAQLLRQQPRLALRGSTATAPAAAR